MTDDELVYHYTKNFLLEIMAVCWANGQRELHVGAMMRIMGIDDATACKHDEERVVIDEDFAAILQNTSIGAALLPKIPKGTPIH